MSRNTNIHAAKYMPHVQHALQDLNMLNKSIQLYFFEKSNTIILCTFYAVFTLFAFFLEIYIYTQNLHFWV